MAICTASDPTVAAAIRTASDPMVAADEAIITRLVYEHAEVGSLLWHANGTPLVHFLGMAAVSNKEARAHNGTKGKL